MSTVKSPCVRNCCLDKQDICIGCGRAVDEIVRWNDADDNEKRDILEVAALRRRRRKSVYPNTF